MPCNSDYMKPMKKEIEASRVACLLDELDGKTWTKSDWDGYHKAIYNSVRKIDVDNMVAELCARLQAVDVKNYSLEMQIWWRDHQKADRERIEFELARKKEEKDRADAIAKLSDYERKLLGL